MCYFVHIAVPRIHSAAVAAWPRIDLHVYPYRGTLLAQFEPDCVAFVITDPSGHCSCELFHGAKTALDEERERARYRAKGWSNPKIDRAIAGRRPKAGRFEGFRTRVADLVLSARLIEICAVEGSDAAVSAFPRLTIRLDDYLAAGGVYPHSTVVAIQAV